MSILSGLNQPDVIEAKDDSTNTVNVSIGNSEVNLSALASERDCNEVRIFLRCIYKADTNARYSKISK